MKLKAVCFGEVLWDIFPDEERIGGAPLNVASRLSAKGIKTSVISRIGQDRKGKDLLTYLEKNKVGTDNIQLDPGHSTGMVMVSLDEGGSASYEISYPAAWDKIELEDRSIKAVKDADAFIFGSLVCRDPISRNTLFQLLDSATFKILDINLRPPHYDPEVLKQLMQAADFIKFNDDELFEITALFGYKNNSIEQNLKFLSEQTNTSSICVTKGKHGAVFLTEGKLFYNSGYRVKVKDTVGAGDSFLASLIAELLENTDPQQALNYACAVGALVAGREGANPELGEAEIRRFMNPLNE